MEARKLEAARALERRGQHAAAAKAYAECGEVEEAARVLVGAKQHQEAGRLLLGSLGVGPGEVGRLDTLGRTRAHRAAALLAQAGDSDLAAQLFLALNDSPRALQAYTTHGRLLPAADLARRLGQHAEAGRLFGLSGHAYEAGVCLTQAGDETGALEQFRRVSRGGEHYRKACTAAAPLARRLRDGRFEIEQFFARFLDSAPSGADELSAFYELARHFLDQGLKHQAREALGKVLAVDPGYRDTPALLASLGNATDARLSLQALPSLPDLPLPDPALLIKPRVTEPIDSGASFGIDNVVADRYRLEQRIGVGASAVVFRATDLELGEEIALKVFTQVVCDEQFDERFKRELKLSRQISNPHVVRLFDIGSFQGVRFISMELLRGQDLRSRLGERIPYDEALDYLIQMCDGLQAAHDNGVVHRDFKPENCFVTSGGVVKVMDFGIAKVQAAPGLTTTGMIAGTPAYMSPEQISDFAKVGFGSDLYSLGVVAYEMFTGAVPFTNPDLLKLMMMHIRDPPTPPRQLNPELPAQLEAILLRMLDKVPGRRFGSCRELAGELERMRLASPRGVA